MTSTIKIADIDTSDRLRPVEQSIVDAYAAIAEERVAAGQSPLIQAIVIRPVTAPGNPGASNGYKLVAGANRLAALIKIGRLGLIVGDDVIIRNEDDETARETEIFENLAHAQMTALDRAIFIGEAKTRFLKRRGDLRAKLRKPDQILFDRKIPESGIFTSEKFTKDVSERLGLGKTQIFEANAIAAALKSTPEIIAELRATPLADNAQELKAVAELDPDNRRRAVAAIRGGQAKTVRDARVAIGLDKKVEPDPQLNYLTTIQDIWANKLDWRHKKKFLADNGLEARKAGDGAGEAA